jgi:hypothetical protein
MHVAETVYIATWARKAFDQTDPDRVADIDE